MRDNIKDYYVYSVNEKTESFGVRITNGRFKNVLVKVGKISLEESQQDDKCVIHFEHEIIENPDDLYLDGNNKLKLDNLLGDIIVDVINDIIISKEEKK